MEKEKKHPAEIGRNETGRNETDQEPRGTRFELNVRGLRVEGRRVNGPAGPTPIEVTGKCRVTGDPYTLCLHLEGLMAWIGGELIQNAFPDLTREDREFLISRTSPEGWKRLFP
jgi:hypothetical protein